MFNLGLANIKNLATDFAESRQRIDDIKKEHDYASLAKVRISVRNNIFSNFIKLQTPRQLGVWGKTAFVSSLNPDFNLVINKPNPYLKLKRDVRRNWLLHIEPPGYIRKLGMDDPRMLESFGKVFTCDPYLYEQGGKFIASPPYVHWHLALSSYTNNENNTTFDYDFLKSFPGVPEKNSLLATINSNMNDLPGHKLRAGFVAAMAESGLAFDLYGTPNWEKYEQYRGRTVGGKWPIYSKAKYVLAIENEVSDLYWTEKFTDAVLCFSMPIYYGTSKINKYFPEGSYIPLDITKSSAIDELKDILKSDFYGRNLPRLLEARNLILNKHNMFNFIDEEVQKFSM